MECSYAPSWLSYWPNRPVSEFATGDCLMIFQKSRDGRGCWTVIDQNERAGQDERCIARVHEPHPLWFGLNNAMARTFESGIAQGPIALQLPFTTDGCGSGRDM